MSFYIPQDYDDLVAEETKRKNKIYKTIIEEIERYNNISETEKITLNIEKKYKVNNVYIFAYKKIFIGIFDKNDKDYGYFYNYNYSSPDNNYNLKGYKIELSKLKKDFNINEAISFNKIREIMRLSYPNLYSEYEDGFATEKEILDVIDYSFKYFAHASNARKRIK